MKKLLMPALLVALVATVAFGSTQASAQTSTTRVSFVQKIAEKFGLNQTEVQAVFDAERTERRADMRARTDARLSQLVTDGKITEAQKQLILAKTKELESQREANMQLHQSLTPEERKEQMEDHRSELRAWAQQNGIDTQYLMLGHGFGQGGFGKYK